MQIASRLTSTPRLAVPRITRLHLDAGCSNRANWCCNIESFTPESGPPEIGTEEGRRVEDCMVRLGYRSHSRHPALKVFRKPDGCELAWVMTSGRVQIRVPMAVDPDRRDLAARAVWGDLQSSLQETRP